MSRVRVSIPVQAILKEYAKYSGEVCNTIADELLQETKKNAQTAYDDRTRELTESIAKFKSKFKKDGYVVGAFVKKAAHVEFGHDMVVKGGRVVGHVPAHPFLGPALLSVRARTAEIIARVSAPSIEVK